MGMGIQQIGATSLYSFAIQTLGANLFPFFLLSKVDADVFIRPKCG